MPSSSSVAMTTSACGADRRPDVLAEAHRAEHAAAALRHALDLAGLDVEAGAGGGLGEDRGAEQDALAADADERDRRGAVHGGRPRAQARLSAPRRHTSTHRPQPVQVSSTRHRVLAGRERGAAEVDADAAEIAALLVDHDLAGLLARHEHAGRERDEHAEARAPWPRP